MITRLTKGNNWKPQHTIGTRYTSDLAWTMNVGIYFANVDSGSWNVESGLASHATIHGVYLHGSCTVDYETFFLKFLSGHLKKLRNIITCWKKDIFFISIIFQVAPPIFDP